MRNHLLLSIILATAGAACASSPQAEKVCDARIERVDENPWSAGVRSNSAKEPTSKASRKSAFRLSVEGRLVAPSPAPSA